MGVNNIKISLKMKNKGWLNKEKIFFLGYKIVFLHGKWFFGVSIRNFFWVKNIFFWIKTFLVRNESRDFYFMVDNTKNFKDFGFWVTINFFFIESTMSVSGRSTLCYLSVPIMSEKL